MSERKSINLSPTAALMFENRLLLINKKREEKNKKKLNRSDLITIAIENITIKQGVEK